MIAAQLRAARALLGIPADLFAEGAGLGVATIRRAESGRDTPALSADSHAKIAAYLDACGVGLVISDDTGGAGVRFMRPNR